MNTFDPSEALSASGLPQALNSMTSDYLQGQQNARLQQQQNWVNQQRAGQVQAGQSLANGDMQGAQTAALNSGNFDLSTQLTTMTMAQRALAAQNANTLYQAIAATKGITGSNPQDTAQLRQQYAQNVAIPYAVAHGVPISMAHVPDGFDWSDQSLDALGSQTLDLKDRLTLGQEQQKINQPKITTLTTASGAQVPLVTNANTGLPITAPAGTTGATAPAGSAPANGAAGSPTVATGEALGRQVWQQITGPSEGGLNPHDANGAPTNFGFNQTANPDIDVHTLTPQTAADRFITKYWNPSGAGNMPPAMAAVYADTYFINPGRARAILKQVGGPNGDPAQFMALRQQWQNNLINKPGSTVAPYAHAYANRNALINQYIAQQQQTAPSQGSPSSPVAAGVPQGTPQDPSQAAPQTAPQTAPQGSPQVPAGYYNPYQPANEGVNSRGAPNDYVWNADHTGVIPNPGGPDDPNMIDEGTKTAGGMVQLLTGQAPSMGMGGIAIKNMYAKRASQIQQLYGIPAESLPAIRAATAGYSQALGNTISQQAAFTTNATAFAKAAALLRQTSAKLQVDGVLGDSPTQNQARLSQFGDPRFGTPQQISDILAYRNALGVLSNEGSKLATSMTGGGSASPTDKTFENYQERLPESTPPSAIEGAIGTMTKEVQNKQSAFESTKNNLLQSTSRVLESFGHIPHVNSVQDAMALPKGITFTDPNGVRRVR